MDALCRSFVEVGHRTSRDLRYAWTSNLLFGEETITETNLLMLRRRHPSRIRVQSFTKQQEAANGADWEWWFVDRSRRIGFPMRVQAKRLPKNSETFKGLLTRQAGSAPKPQIDMLIDSAHQANVVPLHVFYLNEQVMQSLGDSHRTRFGLQNLRAELGCWVGLSDVIRSSQKKSLTGLRSLIFPWHLLVCPKTSEAGGPPPLPVRVRDTLRRAPGRLSQAQASENEIPELQDLPDYARQLLDGVRVGWDTSYALKLGVRGVVLFLDDEETLQ